MKNNEADKFVTVYYCCTKQDYKWLSLVSNNFRSLLCTAKAVVKTLFVCIKLLFLALSGQGNSSISEP
jgi:hypothetical protein